MATLGLDLSTSTGWAIFDDAQPVSFGNISKRMGWNAAPYPANFILVADDIAEQVVTLLRAHPEVSDVVIEEINKTSSRFGSRFAQKCLDMIHYSVLKELLATPVKIHYINTSDWRRTLKLSVADTRKLAKPYLLELKKRKAALAMASKPDKKAAKASLDEHKAVLRKLCIHGKVDKKSISVAYCNATWGMDLKKGDDDTADALCQVQAFRLGCHVLTNADVFDKKVKGKQ
jgi:hypothetical protein